MLSQVVHQKNKTGSLRERLQIKSNEITQRMRGDDIHCDAQTYTTFNILKNLVLFFDFFNDNQHQAALEILESIKLVPLTMAELESCVQNFRRLSGEICKVFPDLLLATMNIVHEKYKMVRGKEGRFENAGRESVREWVLDNLLRSTWTFSIYFQQLMFLREQAKAITNFAASVPYRLPGDTNSRLVQAEILMH
jgi:nuclear pore complex protein Nup93